MLNISYKKEAINYLNKKFSSYKEVQDFCNELGNNPNIIIQMISKVIKFAFASPGCFYSDASLASLLRWLPCIDRTYSLLVAKKGYKPVFKKVNINVPYPLDSDIDLQDLIGLRFPSIELIEKICRENTEINEMQNKKSQDRAEKLKNLSGFSRTAFTYETEELVLLDEDFIYESEGLTGEVMSDFRKLYGDERYQGNNNILYSSYSDNLARILAANDICFNKKGNVYQIVNGRHRILYLLAHGDRVAIRALVIKRIEDERLNELLIELHQRLNIIVFKDTPYSSDSDLCIVYNGGLYLIKSFEDLVVFASSLDSLPSLMPFSTSAYNIARIHELITKIIAFCAANGVNITDISFTQLVLLLNEEASSLVYEAYQAVGYIKNQENLLSEINNLDKEALNR